MHKERVSPWQIEMRPDTAQEAYDLLRRSNDIWSGALSQPRFRGHSDASWKLVPTAWRSVEGSPFETDYKKCGGYFSHIMHVEAPEGYHKYLDFKVEDVDLSGQQFTYECHLINEFYGHCNRVGLPVPEANIEIGAVQYPVPNYGQIAASWIEDTANKSWGPTPIHGIAQHHGLPTRLLDFSYDPKKALLFAVLSVFENFDPNAEFCVWAIGHLGKLNLALEEWRPNRILNINLEFVEFQRAQNLFMKSQDGLFLFMRNADNWAIENGRYPSLEDVINSQLSSERFPDRLNATSIKISDGHNGTTSYGHDGARVPLPLACKIVMRHGMAFDLYALLQRDHLSKLHLMPSFDNTVGEMKFMRKPPEKFS